MGVVQKFGVPKPVSWLLNWSRKYSLWMFQFGLACCAIEMMAASGPRYDFMRFGIIPLPASPRQADLMVVAGTVTDKMAPSIRRLYEQMPEPKYVIGFGSCPVNGGIYWKSYATINHLDKYIPVDLNLTGCMPRPQAVIDGFLTLTDMIRKGEAVGYKKYRLNYEWYRKNQEEVLGRTEAVLEEPERAPGVEVPAGAGGTTVRTDGVT